MKIDALIIEEKEKVAIKQIKLEEPGYSQIQVDVKACGICAWDKYLFQGKGTSEDFPYHFGHEAVGVITEVGQGVNGYKPGDKVFCAGGAKSMAEVINVPANVAGKIPESVTDYSLWVGEPVTCVVNGIDQLPIVPGDQVVVIGSGYMGNLNTQALHRTLVGEIIAFDINEHRLELAAAFGADETYIIFSKRGKEKLKEIEADGGADIVIEVSGTADGLKNAGKILKQGGTLSLFAWHRGERKFDGSQWHLGGFKIINTSPMSDFYYEDRPPQAATLMKRGVFKQEKLVTHVSNYHCAQEILETAIKQEGGYIKGVITF